MTAERWTIAALAGVAGSLAGTHLLGIEAAVAGAVIGAGIGRGLLELMLVDTVRFVRPIMLP